MALVTNIVSGSNASRLLVLLHGYGADEVDLGGLLQYLDPDGAFATVLPRAPLAAPGSPGFAWYDFGGDPAAIQQGYLEAIALVDELVDEQCTALGLERSAAIFAGFSQGAGIALGLGLLPSDRPLPAAILAMSPANPIAEAFTDLPDAARRVPVLVQHGTDDPLIPVQRSRDFARQLRGVGVPTVYREYPMQHQVALESMRDARDWMTRVLDGELPDEELPEDPVELVPSASEARA